MRILDAESGLTRLAELSVKVEGCESSVQDAEEALERARGRLQRARKEFDDARDATLQFCPAIATGYAGAALTETVAIVDGKVAVVPIGESGRPRAAMASAEACSG